MQSLVAALALASIGLGPIPASVAVVGLTVRPGRRAPVAHAALVLLVCWSAVQSVIGLALGGTGFLALGPVVALEILTALGGELLRRRTIAGVPAPASVRPPREWVVVALLAAVICHLGWILTTKALTDFDSLAYHLPTMAGWYQTGGLPILEPMVRLQIGRYPYGWELVCALFLLPFREDVLVAAPNLLIWAVLGLSVFLAALEIGASRSAALASVVLLLLTRLVYRHVPTLHVDLALAAFFAAGLYFLLASDGHELRDLALAMLAVGLTVAIKTSGLVYAALLTGGLILLRLWPTRPHSDPRQGPSASGVLVAAGAVASLIGGYWYVRNLIDVGNPLGFVPVAAGGVVLFPGWLDMEHLRRTTVFHLFDFTSLRDWRVMIAAIWQELGLPFVLLLTALLFPLPPRSLRLPPSRAAHRALLTGLLLTTAMAYLVSPYSGDNGEHGWRLTRWTGQAFRFGFPGLSVVAIVAAVRATHRGWNENLMVAAAVVVGVAAVGGRAVALGGALLTAGLLAIAVAPWLVGARSARWRHAVVAVTTGGIVVATLRGVQAERHESRVKRYGPIFALATRTGAAQQTIGNVSLQQRYPLYGEALATRVRDVRSLPEESRADWVARLVARDACVVTFGPNGAHKPMRRELSWVLEMPETFEAVLGTDPAREPVAYRRRDSACPATVAPHS